MIWTLCLAMVVIFYIFGAAILIMSWLRLVLTITPRWLKVIFDLFFKIGGK